MSMRVIICSGMATTQSSMVVVMRLLAWRTNRHTLVGFTNSLVHFLEVAWCLGLRCLLSCTSILALVVICRIIRTLVKVLKVLSLLLEDRWYTHFWVILICLVMMVHLVIWIMVMRWVVFVTIGYRWGHVAEAYIVRHWCHSVRVRWLGRVMFESTIIVLKYLWSDTFMLLLRLVMIVLLVHGV